MRRVSAFLFLVAASAAALGQESWKWDPSKRHAPAVGDRWFQVDDELEESKSVVTVGKEAPRNEDAHHTLKYRVVRETLAVEGDKVTKERISIDRWSLQKSATTPEDKSLAGKAVVVEGAGEKRKLTYEGASDDLSPQAKSWAQLTLGRTDPTDELEKLYPKEPVEPDGEWTVDAAKLADEIFKGAEIDAQRSSVKGSLKNVRVENGVHVGDVEVKVALQLKKVPDAPIAWKDGGLVELTVEMKGSLEPDKDRRRNVKMDFKLKGEAAGDGEGGPVTMTMDMKIATSFSSGDLPRK
jgi:hypothetical protein